MGCGEEGARSCRNPVSRKPAPNMPAQPPHVAVLPLIIPSRAPRKIAPLAELPGSCCLEGSAKSRLAPDSLVAAVVRGTFGAAQGAL